MPQQPGRPAVPHNFGTFEIPQLFCGATSHLPINVITTHLQLIEIVDLERLIIWDIHPTPNVTFQSEHSPAPVVPYLAGLSSRTE